MDCATFRELTPRLEGCVPDDEGSRFKTHCMYPSFSPVFVTVSAWGDGFRVSDSGGASDSVLRHGIGAAAVTQGLKAAQKKYHLDEKSGVLSLRVESAEWLESAVLAVANASAYAAHTAHSYVEQKSAKDFIPQIISAISSIVPPSQIATEFSLRGKSGKVRNFDVAVIGPKRLLFKAITPAPGSINSAFVLFSDTFRIDGTSPETTFGVYRDTIASEDAILLNEVATLSPLRAVGSVASRAVSRPT